ncbi:MAG: DeoR/GlpR family DNA-binding transcription regulator [Actinomycetaceae bacterium]|nr:DeoR/GlpR family DNA-binding transcription regulator [Actinomycetaceae bacterium]
MIPGARHQVILGALQRSGVAAVADLAKMTNVSASTIRRDLEHLEEEGLITRTCGGAIMNGERDRALSSVAQVNSEAKDRIGRTCAGFVSPGDTVVIDVGTTALAAARHLVDLPITVITASLPVLRMFAESESARVIGLGGSYVPEYECFGGPLTAQSMLSLSADVAIIGASGVSRNAHLRDTTSAQVPVKQAIMARADRSILAVDEDKFPGEGSYTVAAVGDIDVIVTNAELSEDLRERCGAATIEEVRV